MLFEYLKVGLERTNSKLDINITTFHTETGCDMDKVHYRTLEYAKKISVSEVAKKNL